MLVMGLTATVWTAKVQKRAPKRATKAALSLNHQNHSIAIPVLSTFWELAISYTLLNPLAFQMVTNSVSIMITLYSTNGQKVY